MKRLAIIIRAGVSIVVLAFLLDVVFRAEAATELAAHPALGWLDQRALAWTIGPRELGARIAAINGGWLAAALVLQATICVLSTVRWRRLLRVQRLELSLGRAAEIVLIGRFFDAFMLGSTGGDVARAWLVARECSDRKVEAVTTVIVDRLIGLGTLVVIALIAMAVSFERITGEPRLRTAALGVLAIAAAMAVVGTLAMWRRFATALPRLHGWLERRPGYATAQRIVAAYRAIATQPRALVTALAITVGIHAASILAIVCIGTGLGLSVPLGDYVVMLPIINIIVALPISISGLGVREGLYVMMFSAAGLTASDAIALSLLGHVTYLVWSIVGGAAFIADKRKHPGRNVNEAPGRDA
ncbi:MAG: lysylphosphatidylglycerol synthase transmembrane domain-containing protein [Kofleriaceae bacterium]